MKKIIHINIVCQYPFPIGYSGTNRILSYAKELVALGHHVHVNTLFSTEEKSQVINQNARGTYCGITFEYPFRTTIKSNVKILRIVEVVLGCLLTLYKIYKYRRQNRTDVLLISDDNPFLLFLFVIFSKTIGVDNTVLIVDEYPAPIRYGKEKLSRLRKLLFKFSLRKINGFIYMTSILHDFYSPILGSKTKTLLLPMTVETERFNSVCNDVEESVVYIGNLDVKKDGVDILIKAFESITKDFPNLKLMLYGKGSIENESILKKLVESFHLENKVFFLGKVERDLVPEILSKAKVLALSRPTSLRADAGFPTKLGEYLASGRPVVVTKVGEIPNYLNHLETAYLAEPDSVQDFALKLSQVLDDYSQSEIIGAKGRTLALSVFNSNVQAKKMSDFLRSL